MKSVPTWLLRFIFLCIYSGSLLAGNQTYVDNLDILDAGVETNNPSQLSYYGKIKNTGPLEVTGFTFESFILDKSEKPVADCSRAITLNLKPQESGEFRFICNSGVAEVEGYTIKLTSVVTRPVNQPPSSFNIAGACLKGSATIRTEGNNSGSASQVFDISIRNTCGYQISYRLCAYSTDNNSNAFLGWRCGTATGPNAAGWLRPGESRKLMPETWSGRVGLRVAECKAPFAVGNTPTNDGMPIQCGKCPSPGLCGQ